MTTETTPGNCRENSKNKIINRSALNAKKISSLVEYFETFTGAKTTKIYNGVGGVGTTSKHKRSSAASGRANDKSDVDHVTSQGKIKPIGGGNGHVEQESVGESQWI